MNAPTARLIQAYMSELVEASRQTGCLSGLGIRIRLNYGLSTVSSVSS
jgi:hypothetical protein